MCREYAPTKVSCSPNIPASQYHEEERICEESGAGRQPIKPPYCISVPIQFIFFHETCISTLKETYSKSATMLHYPRHCRTLFQVQFLKKLHAFCQSATPQFNETRKKKIIVETAYIEVVKLIM